MAKPTNPRIDELVKPLIEKALTDAASDATTIATAKANEAVGAIFLGSGDALPTGEGATKGQLFIRTGASNPGLYMCTTGGESTSTWTAVAAAT